MKKKEIIIFSVVFLIALISILIIRFTNQAEIKTVLITVDGEEYKRVQIDNSTQISFTVETEHGINKVEISQGKVNVIWADCPNQVCVNTKEASRTGDIIVCLPHKVVIEIIEAE